MRSNRMRRQGRSAVSCRNAQFGLEPQDVTLHVLLEQSLWSSRERLKSLISKCTSFICVSLMKLRKWLKLRNCRNFFIAFFSQTLFRRFSTKLCTVLLAYDWEKWTCSRIGRIQIVAVKSAWTDDHFCKKREYQINKGNFRSWSYTIENIFFLHFLSPEMCSFIPHQFDCVGALVSLLLGFWTVFDSFASIGRRAFWNAVIGVQGQVLFSSLTSKSSWMFVYCSLFRVSHVYRVCADLNYQGEKEEIHFFEGRI